MQAVTQQMSIGWHVIAALQRDDFSQAARCLQQLDSPHWLRRWLQPRILAGLRHELQSELETNQLDAAWHSYELAAPLIRTNKDQERDDWRHLQQQLTLRSIHQIEQSIQLAQWDIAQQLLKQLRQRAVENWRIERLAEQLQAAHRSQTKQTSRADVPLAGDSNEGNETEFPDAVMMWIDGIGGFLLVTAPEAWIGRYVEQPGVQIALAADLHRRHARVDYWDSAHWLSLKGPGNVDGQMITSTQRLMSGQTIRLGGSTELNYRQPYPNTGTATLTMSGAHRTIPWSDAIILLGESLMIGSGRRSHIYCPDWERTLVFFRCRGQLYLRCGGSNLGGPIELDGRRLDAATHLVRPDSRIVGDRFAIKFEPLEIAKPQSSGRLETN